VGAQWPHDMRGGKWNVHMSAHTGGSPDIPTVVIPYRGREDHLRCMLARLHHMPVVVVEQCDAHPFNRGSLLNAGYLKAREGGAHRVILHDVDLVPDDTLLAMYSERWPKPVVHFGARFARYNNSNKYFGGVHGFVGGYYPGYPNHYYGWGGEDDALRKRVSRRDVTFARKGQYLDLEGHTTARDKLDTLQPEQKCNNRWELLDQDDVRADNHRVHTASRDERWERQQDNVLWGYITHHREA